MLACGLLLPGAIIAHVTSANAAVQILSGPGGGNPSENVLFNNNPPDGLTVKGITNTTHRLVDFTGIEILHGNGGAARLDAHDGAFGKVSWVLDTPNFGYTDLKFDIEFPGGKDATGPITIDILNQFGVHTLFTETLHGNGNNFFQAHATGGDLIMQVTLTGAQWTDLEQIRLGGFEDPLTTAVPEPSTWALMLIGFGGLGLVAYRRARKPTAILSTS